MRTFTRCLVVVALVAMTVPAWSQPAAVPTAPVMTQADSLVAIDRLARKISAANPEYPDPYKVPIGVQVYVPTATGPKVFYETEPWQLGQMGCFWHIAGYHLFGKRMEPPDLDDLTGVIPPDTTAKMAPVAQAGDSLRLPWWVPILLAIFGLAGYLYDRRRKRRQEEARLEEERQLDPRTDPPVVPGGLADNPEEAIKQIQAATLLHHGSNRQVVSVQRGRLHNTTGGEQSFITRAEFGDGKVRRKRLEEGTICWQVVVREPEADEMQEHTEYWLHHCGNRVMERRDGQFTLPDGWEFVPESAVAAHIPEAELVVAAATQGVPAPDAPPADGTTVRQYSVKVTVTNGKPEPTVYEIVSEGGRFIKGLSVTRAGTVQVDL